MITEKRLAMIRKCLNDALAPSKLAVIDEGHKHIGHAGAQTGRGHFHVIIASPKFKDKSTLECHRLIYATLGELMQTDIHALRITVHYSE